MVEQLASRHSLLYVAGIYVAGIYVAGIYVAGIMLFDANFSIYV